MTIMTIHTCIPEPSVKPWGHSDGAAPDLLRYSLFHSAVERVVGAIGSELALADRVAQRLGVEFIGSEFGLRYS
jgi:hypothetical protein